MKTSAPFSKRAGLILALILIRGFAPAAYAYNLSIGCHDYHHAVCPRHGCTVLFPQSQHVENNFPYNSYNGPFRGAPCRYDVYGPESNHGCWLPSTPIPPPDCNPTNKPADGPQRVLKIGTAKLEKITKIFADSLTNMSEKSKTAGTPARIFDSAPWKPDPGINVYMQVKPFCCSTNDWRNIDTINGEVKFGKSFFSGTWLIPVPIPGVNGRLTLSAEVEPRILVDNAVANLCVNPEIIAVSIKVAGKLEAKLGMEVLLGLIGGAGLANVGMAPTVGLVFDLTNPIEQIYPRPNMRINWQPKINVGIEISFLYGAITHQYVRALDGESFGFL